MLGERVQVGVGRAVARLRAAPDDSRDGGEEHEEVEFTLAEQFVQGSGALRLGGHVRSEVGGVGLGQRAHCGDPGGVHDAR